MAVDVPSSGEDMVLLTPDEINRFILTLKVRYGSCGPEKQQQHRLQKKRPVKALHA
ncbi:MAG TPA: hypothetical protein VHA09_01635 [Nitrososphaera sp.]|nr:hypothetical protein [Nitrososphaera sp.]